jgi:hypothetical protein
MIGRAMTRLGAEADDERRERSAREGNPREGLRRTAMSSRSALSAQMLRPSYEGAEEVLSPAGDPFCLSTHVLN